MIESHGIGFSLTLHHDPPVSPPGIFLHLSVIRIFKEALANVVKHAEATQVEAVLTVSRQAMALAIEDPSCH